MKIPKYLYDFYSVSLKYERGSMTKQQESAIRVFLEEIEEQLLKDVRYCVYRELRHSPSYTQTLTFPELKISYGHRYGGLSKHGLTITLKRVGDQYFSKAEKCFRGRDWWSAYGGPKWAKIAKMARLLEKDNFQDLGNTIVLIDRLIDAAHNTGRCLDKVYPGINDWLNKKRYTKKPQWILSGSNRQIRHIFR